MYGVNENVVPGLKDPTLERDGHQTIDIYLSCRSLKNADLLSKSDPQITVYFQGKLFGRTEVIKNNLNPNFAKSFRLDFMFEKKQEIKFVIQDDDGNGKFDDLGEVTTTLGSIMGAKNQVSLHDILLNGKKHGTLVARGEVVDANKGTVQAQFGAKLKQVGGCLCFGGSPNPQFILSRLSSNEGGEKLNVYKSKEVKGTKYPVWDLMKISLFKICGNDMDRPVTISVLSGNNLIGEGSFTIKQLNEENIKEIPLYKNKVKIGVITVNQFAFREQASFLEYVRGGVQLNVIGCVDFTQSNVDQTRGINKHQRHPNGQLNDYQKALLATSDILLCYDHDKFVPLFGFGGKPPGNQKVSHCFPMNLNYQDPNVFQIDGIMNTYQYALDQVNLSGPTFFGEVIQTAMQQAADAKAKGSVQYIILLILTDGIIHDFQKTKDLLVAACDLPLSVIVVGIGDEDFEKMDELDGDDEPLRNSKGEKAKRDITQFVRFNKYKGNKEMLAEEVLAEVPGQLLQYMNSQGIKPNQRPQFDLNQLVVQNPNGIQNFLGGVGAQQQQQQAAPQQININLQGGQ